MSVSPLQVWIDTLKALPPAEVWAPNFASWVADRTIDAELDPSAGATFTFVYGESALATALEALGPNPSKSLAIKDFADAWEVGLLASTLTTATASGFSSIAKTELDPPSIIAGKAKIQELEFSPLTSTSDSEFPPKFRDATLLLTVTLTGTSTGGDPKVLENVPVI